MRVWLWSREAAEYLGVSIHTLATWRQRKTGPAYYKAGPTGHAQYKMSDLEAFRAARRIDYNA